MTSVLPLWTFLAERDGGNYVAQVEAASVEDATSLFVTSELAWLPVRICDADEFDPPTPLEGIENTWFFFVDVVGAPVYVNIVKTDRS